MKSQTFSKRLLFALDGIREAFRREASFRFQCVATLLVIITAIFLNASPLWWSVLLLTSGAVLTAELLNTALEHLLDRLHPELHPHIKLAKDCAAGAVLVASLISVGVFVAFLYCKH